MGATGPAEKLGSHRPESSLLSIPTVASVLFAVGTQLAVQIPVFFGFRGGVYNPTIPVDTEDRTANWPHDVNTLLW